MKPLFTADEFTIAKSKDLLPLECKVCHETFFRKKKTLPAKNSPYHADHCSLRCYAVTRTKKIDCTCLQCGIIFKKKLHEIKRNNNKKFCSKSCACTFKNFHKTTGIRRSKLELWLQKQLSYKYPTHNILYCDKTSIGSELDIYIPSLKLAFEINGIHHCKPIYGQIHLDKIQSNDDRKLQACLKQGIELTVIDSSSLNNFKEQDCQKYLDVIKNIIELKMGG